MAVFSMRRKCRTGRFFRYLRAVPTRLCAQSPSGFSEGFRYARVRMRLICFRLFTMTSAFGLMLMAGCLSHQNEMPIPHGEMPVMGNIYGTPLPVETTRLAILPAAWPENIPGDRKAMDDAVVAAISRTGRLVAIPVDLPTARDAFGQGRPRSLDYIPGDAFARLHRVTAMEAVLFVEIVHYRPYRPIEITLRMRMIDPHSLQALWAIEGTYNSGHPGTARAAIEYASAQQLSPAPIEPQPTILVSPRQFTRFALDSTLATLPPRLEPVQRNLPPPPPAITAPTGDPTGGDTVALDPSR